MTTIFISYRRSDSQDQTRRLYDRLAKDFGRDNVFIDIDSMPLGNDFPTVLDRVLTQSRIVLVVIGPTWETVTESSGARRLYNPQDFVRLEVEGALLREMPVVPVLVDGGRVPNGRKLPVTLRPLCRRHAIEILQDGDLDRLVLGLKRLLAERLTDLPAEATVGAADGDEMGVIGCDREFPLIDEQIATGSKLIVLVGPTGIGKTVTGLELARRHTPPDPGRRNILQIDARKEFYELSLVEAVGEAYPDEFYRDQDGAPFTSLPFHTQRHIAAELLAKKKATVILDGPGEALYPRNAAAEAELAVRMAKELSAKSILVLIATRNAACWADHNPVLLRGLSPNNSRALFRREFLKWSPSTRPEDLANRLSTEPILTNLIMRGCPGELIAAAQQTAVGQPASTESRPGFVVRLAGAARRGAESLLGDPVLLPPKRPGTQSTGPGPLFVICTALLLVSSVSLFAAYGSGSPMWERMFYDTHARESEVRPLGAWPASRPNPGPGTLVELGRSAIMIVGFVLVLVGRFLGKEAAELVPHLPWSRLGPRRLGLRSLFRIVFLALVGLMGASTVFYHLHDGPGLLWKCRGNPYHQGSLDADDPAQTRQHPDKPNDSSDKWSRKPPEPGKPDYDEYRRQCLRPYQFYLGYSFILFALAGPAVLTVSFYAVCSSLWDHLITQPRLIGELRDDANPRAVNNRLRYFEGTYVEDINRYLVFLLLLLVTLAYHLWWDQYNLTVAAATNTMGMIVFVLAVWGALFSVLILTYPTLVQEAAKRIPEGPPRDTFHRRHGVFPFFLKTVFGSSYFWLCPLAGLAGALYLVCARVSGWELR